MPEAPARSRHAQLFEFVLIVALAVGLALSVQAYAVKPYRIPSESMLPTLKVGDRVLVNRLSHRLGSAPKVGQVVVFTPPAGAEAVPARCGVQDRNGRACPAPTPRRASTTFVKRVVAVGGDRISIRGGHVIRNGVRERDAYTLPCRPDDGCDFPRAITIPRGDVFLMGDNRGNSDDSRFWGPIPRAWVIGQASLRYWPLGRLGTP
ncbi:signal peptidase I [Paraconexibacter antarcticus]|uniref:Signal peptidase I n=1 Tax=Paraconexibacter antarcticus TaxID=2949664 RepID=A0ABY5DMK3_9ACTN|nr:signal peptidase I [Paraconexibacter antarcticus]UTI62383.1 signal peptidase I [Paraconexibacter antarcticus]